MIVKYDGEFYPAKIVNINPAKNEYYCCAMKKSGENWKWPDKHDLLWYELNEIVMKIEEPKPVNTRGVFHVPEMRTVFQLTHLFKYLLVILLHYFVVI